MIYIDTYGWSEFWFCPRCGDNNGDIQYMKLENGDIDYQLGNKTLYICNNCEYRSEFKDLYHSYEEFQNNNRTKLINEMLNDKRKSS